MALFMGEKKVAGYGTDGLSAYEYAKKYGYTGTEEEFGLLMTTIGKIQTEEDIKKIVVNEAINAQKLGNHTADSYTLTKDIPNIKVNNAIHADSADEATNATTLENKSVKTIKSEVMTEVEAKKYLDAVGVADVKVKAATTADNALKLGGVEAVSYALKNEIPDADDIKVIEVNKAIEAGNAAKLNSKTLETIMADVKATKVDNATTADNALSLGGKLASEYYDTTQTDAKIKEVVDKIPEINDATNAIKGKVKLSDAVDGTEVAANGATAATPAAVKQALTDAKAYVDGKKVSNFENDAKYVIGDKVATIKALTLAEYNALEAKEPDTAYYITDEDTIKYVLESDLQANYDTSKEVDAKIAAIPVIEDGNVGTAGKVKLSDTKGDLNATNATAATPKAVKDAVKDVVKSVDYSSSTGILTITPVEGQAKTINLPLESFVEKGAFNPETGDIELTIKNQTEVVKIPAKALVNIYKADNITLELIADSEGVYNTFKIKDNYIAGVKVNSATNADIATNATNLGNTPAADYALKTYVDTAIQNNITSVLTKEY